MYVMFVVLVRWNVECEFTVKNLIEDCACGRTYSGELWHVGPIGDAALC